MHKVIDFPDCEVVEQEAAEWLVKLDGDTMLQPEELRALREWMHRSPVHRDELISFGEFWSDQSLVALPISLEALYYDTALVNENEKQRWFPLQRTILAALVVGVCVALVFNFEGLPGYFGVDTIAGSSKTDDAMYATAIGQQRTVTLPDGSIVYLNTNSQIRIDYSAQYRNILLLQGEVFFDVAKQPERPFHVYAGRGRVQAVGTAFTVYYRENDDIDVTVMEGKVALSVLSKETSSSQNHHETSDDKVELTELSLPKVSKYYVTLPVEELGVLEAGQATTILIAQESESKEGHKLAEIETIAQEELERRGAWRSGLLVFTGNSLEEVAMEIGRYTKLSIEIVDPELKKLRIGGRFSLESTSALFNALEANFNLKITQLDYNRVQISSAEKNKIK